MTGAHGDMAILPTTGGPQPRGRAFILRCMGKPSPPAINCGKNGRAHSRHAGEHQPFRASRYTGEHHGVERADDYEGTNASARAVHRESTVWHERAGIYESTGFAARAVVVESTDYLARAEKTESTNSGERATELEGADGQERAVITESTGNAARAD